MPNGIKWSFVFPVIILVLTGTGCWKRIDEKEVVARVGSAVLTKSALKEQMSWEGFRADQQSNYIERWVNRELLFAEARQQGLDQNRELQYQLDLFEKEQMIHQLMERTFAERISIDEDEITSYYEKNKDQFVVQEDEVRIYHLLTKDRQEAELARQEIRAGKPFRDVAKERSIGFFKDEGGDMGFIRRQDVIPELSRTAFMLPEGRLSSIIPSKHGYHLIQVVKKRNAGNIKELSEVRDEIIQRLRVTKESAVYYDLVYQLRNRIKVYISVPSDNTELPDSLAIESY